MTDTRRRFSRSKVELDAALHLDGGRIVRGTTTDLGARGFFLQTPEQVDVGEGCDVRIRLSTGLLSLQLEGEGVVVRATGEGVGVELEAVAYESLAHLRDLIRRSSDDAQQVDDEFRSGGAGEIAV